MGVEHQAYAAAMGKYDPQSTNIAKVSTPGIIQRRSPFSNLRRRSPSRDRAPKCPIYFNRHSPTHCYARGEKSQPL